MRVIATGMGLMGRTCMDIGIWREWILKCTWETDEWYGEHVK